MIKQQAEKNQTAQNGSANEAANQSRSKGAQALVGPTFRTLQMASLIGCIVGFSGSYSLASEITTVIRMKSKVSMQELADQVQNPNSPRYHQYFSAQEIRDLAGPTEQEYRNELSLLQREGFKIVAESPTHLWVSVKGEASSFEQTFSTSLESVGPGQHRPKTRAVIPTHLRMVAGVIGLDNSRTLRPRIHFAPLTKKKPPVDPNAIPGIPSGAIQKIYGFDQLYSAGLTGAGQHIAVATYSGFNLQDVNDAYRILKLPTTPKVDVVSFNGDATYDSGAAGETELDAQMAGMIAPGANIHVFTSSVNGDTGEAQMFTAILDDGRSKVVNYSWGGCEPGVSSQHQAEMVQIFQRAVAQGVNIMVATGDSGSDSCQDGSTKADWPAANENVVAVGGTSLSLDSSNHVVEVAWTKSGGGVSELFSIPTWQQGVTTYKMRAYPDVSFNADPASGQAIYYSKGTAAPTWIVVGGTSMAAPQWAGFMALVGEARAKNNMGPVGFINPLIYSAAAQSQKVLFDITSGSNGMYQAGPGWDAVTGFGSLNAPGMLKFLTSN